MDMFISTLKSKFKKSDNEGGLVHNTTDEAESANKRKEEVRQTLSKVDPNALVDVDDMVQLAEVPDSSHESGSDNASKLGSTQDANTLQRALGILKKPGTDEEDNKPDTMINPIEDDVFIYYD